MEDELLPDVYLFVSHDNVQLLCDHSISGALPTLICLHMLARRTLQDTLPIPSILNINAVNSNKAPDAII